MTARHRGQFLLTADRDLLPADGPGERWDLRSVRGWTLATCDLPVVQLIGAGGQQLGWLLGHAVDGTGLVRSDLSLPGSVGPTLGPDDLEDLIEGLAGRFALVIHGPVAPLVVLDSYGSLAAVHAPGRGVASVPALLGTHVDADLARDRGFPARTTWQPFGRTLYPGVRRLQADHVLDLATGDTRRSWLPPEPDDSTDTGAAAVEVLAHLRHVITSVAAHHPLVVPLTAGRDSRVLLAACGPLRSDVATFTLVHPGRRSVDRAVAVRLAARAGVPLELLRVADAGGTGPDEWLHSTGHALGGELWRSQSALAGLDPAAVLLPGTAGEVGRAHMLRPGDDLQDGTVTPELLLRRLRTPADDTSLQDAADWLDRLPHLSFVATLELAYVEQRLSCWAGPGHYGNRRSAFEVSPFSGRALFRRLLSLPVEHRRGERLTDDLLALAWPGAAGLPFNEFPGLEGTARRAVRRARSAVRSVRGAA